MWNTQFFCGALLFPVFPVWSIWQTFRFQAHGVGYFHDSLESVDSQESLESLSHFKEKTNFCYL